MSARKVLLAAALTVAAVVAGLAAICTLAAWGVQHPRRIPYHSIDCGAWT